MTKPIFIIQIPLSMVFDDTNLNEITTYCVESLLSYEVLVLYTDVEQVSFDLFNPIDGDDIDMEELRNKIKEYTNGKTV